MDLDALAQRLLDGDRRALARAVTLVESARADHRGAAEALLARLPARDALRVGVTGTPGAGKSTLVEALGMGLVGAGRRVAVLAVDPSSPRTGGSVLGDKTRMERLAREAGAFVRPSPAGGEAGGVARRTREAILLCEAAGFDPVIVETVGVGQGEVAAADLVDVLVLVLSPLGGDELQGVKRGIMEAADVVAVNKADADPGAAGRAVGDHAAALRLLGGREGDPAGYPLAMAVSALTGEGVGALWEAVEGLARARGSSGARARARAAQRLRWFEEEFARQGLDRLRARVGGAEALRAAVAGGLFPPEAARRALDGLG